MFNISLSTKNIITHTVDCYAYIVEKNFKTSVIDDELKKNCPDLLSVVKQKKFIAKYKPHFLKSLLIQPTHKKLE